MVFSASSEARDRNAPTNANQIRLQTSRIRQEHRPIRYQLPVGLSFRQGQGSALCADKGSRATPIHIQPHIAPRCNALSRSTTPPGARARCISLSLNRYATKPSSNKRRVAPSGVGKLPVQLSGPAVERARLQRAVVDPDDRRDLGEIAAGKDLVGAEEISVAQGGLDVVTPSPRNRSITRCRVMPLRNVPFGTGV
jgi:hypothetical protein